MGLVPPTQGEVRQITCPTAEYRRPGRGAMVKSGLPWPDSPSFQAARIGSFLLLGGPNRVLVARLCGGGGCGQEG